MPRPNSKEDILKSAVILARKKGLFKFARVEVAEEAEVCEGTVSYHFGTMRALRKAIVERAVQNELLSILADASASRESVGVTIPEDLRSKVAAFIAS